MTKTIIWAGVVAIAFIAGMLISGEFVFAQTGLTAPQRTAQSLSEIHAEIGAGREQLELQQIEWVTEDCVGNAMFEVTGVESRNVNVETVDNSPANDSFVATIRIPPMGGAPTAVVDYRVPADGQLTGGDFGSGPGETLRIQVEDPDGDAQTTVKVESAVGDLTGIVTIC